MRRYTDREHEPAYRLRAVGGFLTLAAVVSATQPIQTYGYWAVFLAVGLESLGVPIPGETTLIAAALYAGSTHRLNFVTLGIVAAAAAIVGDNIGYLIGRFGGYRLLRRYGHYVRVDEAKLKVGRYLFDRHGGKVVFFGRFISVLRTYAAFLAGVNMMVWRRFLLYNAAGGIALGGGGHGQRVPAGDGGAPGQHGDHHCGRRSAGCGHRGGSGQRGAHTRSRCARGTARAVRRTAARVWRRSTRW